MTAYTVKLPLNPNGPEGYYNITQLAELTKQNFRNLLLTSPGERPMLMNFGVGLRDFLFELNTIELHSAIKTRIREQVNKYMSYIEIGDIEIDDPESFGDRPAEIFTLNIYLNYYIKPLGQIDEMELSIGKTPSVVRSGDIGDIIVSRDIGDSLPPINF